MSGMAVGTPAYMSPEQAEGKRCDARSDVYSLGATLYELVTGHAPFEGKEPLGVLDKVRSEDPIAPRKYNPKLDPEIETIVAKAMEKAPGRRYRSAKAFAEDLRRHLAGEPILAKPASTVDKAMKWMKRHRGASAVGAVLLAGLTLLGVVLTANSIRFHRKIRDLERKADGFEAGGKFGDAADYWREIRTLLPEHPYAAERAAQLRARADAAARRRAAAEWIEKGRAARGKYETLRAKRDVRRAEAKQLEEEIPKYEGESTKKQRLWTAQKEVDSLEEEAALRYTDTLVSYTRALGVDPDNAEAREALADFYFDEFKEAEKNNNRREMKAKEQLVQLFGEAKYGRELVWEGTLDLESEPSGAEVELLRYGEGPDRRLVPAHLEDLGRCPIAKKKLDAGSYLLILRKPGYRDVRYPVLIGRGTSWVGRVNLYTEEEIGEDFLYVPGGAFIMGRDKDAYNVFDPTREKAPPDPGDYFIAKYEVTFEKYLEFLNDRTYHDLDQAWKRTPRQMPEGGQYWTVGEEPSTPLGPKKILMTRGWEKWPAIGISWEDAHAYGLWRAKKEGGGGMYRLPTSAEWEKAARGVDGRCFPWGDHLDWSFTSGGESKSGQRLPENIGEFGKDESPYGARDMGGGIREWCEDGPEQIPGCRYLRGGARTFTSIPSFLCATRTWVNLPSVNSIHGFRLVRLPAGTK
ncbi:MAG: SUMF1/EgtB/PvdO family nonheme iron enzyme [Planctomycetes bacterium]|nr:SUMF1/EgtB/PvdO family nonheme iron enzyme [Planctomycetota bacterium]